ncbi:MAG: glycosyltransferase family 2 protein [Flavobacteriales bacterium]|jgi:glycosyltransferase involved in cell wall biosynthesis|nr:MAG: glycosyltransferase family 2 protein [Flavobacteriales bacterium]
MSTLRGGRRERGLHPSAKAGKPVVSIVTVVFNGAFTLERTIQSVLGQSYPFIEYIVVDGGSTDGTLELLRRYEDRVDLWVSERDKGIYDAMNKGVALATGEWVALINADDWYEPEAVARAMEAAKDRPATNIVHGDIWIHYPNGHRKVKRARQSGFLLKYWEMVLNHPSFFVRRSYYKGRPFDAALRVSGDHKWTVQAWMESSGQFLYLPEPLANFTAGGASMRIPLKKVLAEGRRVSRDIGLGPGGMLLGQLVRVALYVPQYLKLLFNQYISPLAGKRA